MIKENVVICPPCGENVALATKRGANQGNLILPLLPRLTAVLPPQGREMTTAGFTLIELLVVVLIIGILAAVALPQYKKAVIKARGTEAITMIKSIIPAVEEYMLINAEFPTDWTKITIAPTGEISNFSKTNDQMVIGNYRYLLYAGRINASPKSDDISAPRFIWPSQYSTVFTQLDPKNIYCYYNESEGGSILQQTCASYGPKQDADPVTEFYLVK